MRCSLVQGKGARPRGGLGFVTPVGVTEPKPLCVSGDPIRLSLARVRILRGGLTVLSLITHHHTQEVHNLQALAKANRLVASHEAVRAV